MDLFANLALGAATAFTPLNLVYCFLGVLLGTLVGVLPGVGPTAAIAMLLPATFSFEPATALIMLAGIYYGAQYGGSTTAVLLNLPGETSSAVTAIDGYQMARQGRAGTALATAAVGSFFAGTVATFVLALFAPPLARIALEFGPPEYFALIVLGLLASIALAHGSVVKSLMMIMLGVLLSLVGQDIYSGTPRFTFGRFELFQGLNFVAVAVGLFGLAEVLRNLEQNMNRDVMVRHVKGLWLTRKDIKDISMPVLRGTIIGSVLGILPGAGHVLSSFASYVIEKRIARNPARFGHGAIEGVAGPESANNAAAQTSFIPMLTLGLPAHPVMALMIGAFIIQGITPGPNVIRHEPELFWGIIVSMWIGNFFLILLNLPLIGIWVRLLTVPYRVLFPAVIGFACIGTYSINMNVFDIYTIVAFGVIGYVLVKLNCEPAPMLLGFVLGAPLEEYLRRSLILSRGDPSIFLTRPLAAGLLAVAVIVAIAALMPAIRSRREVIFQEEE